MTCKLQYSDFICMSVLWETVRIQICPKHKQTHTDDFFFAPGPSVCNVAAL